MDDFDIRLLLRALDFAARKHKDQRRKGRGASPYINHPIEVAAILADAGVTDSAVLAAAVLHDTVEDTQTTPEEIEALFGPDVRELVEEMTDDKRLASAKRKELQVLHAPHLSRRAKLIKIADKIANIRDISHEPPPDWTISRRQQYLNWAQRVVNGCRGVSAALEKQFDEMYGAGTAFIEEDSRGSRVESR